MQINLNPTSERGASRDACHSSKGDPRRLSLDFIVLLLACALGPVCDLLCCRGNSCWRRWNPVAHALCLVVTGRSRGLQSRCLESSMSKPELKPGRQPANPPASFLCPLPLVRELTARAVSPCWLRSSPSISCSSRDPQRDDQVGDLVEDQRAAEAEHRDDDQGQQVGEERRGLAAE